MNNLVERDVNMDETLDSDKEARSVPQVRPNRALRTKANRRSLSGAPLTGLIENNKFQHFRSLQRSQRDTRGLNYLLAPVSGGPLYRSSLPVTPIATPIISQALKFTEQSLHNRILMQSQLPRHGLFHQQFEQPDISEDIDESQTSVPESDRLNPTLSSSSGKEVEKARTTTETRDTRAGSSLSHEVEKEKKQSRLSSTSSRLSKIFGSKTKTQKQQRAKNR